MELDKMIFFRNFLFRTFLVGVALAVFIAIFMGAFRDLLMPFASSVFRLEEIKIKELLLAFFLDVRLVLLFFFLAPALALHWMIRNKK